MEVEAWHFTDQNKDQIFNELRGNKAPDHDEGGSPILRVTTIHGEEAIVRLGDWVIADGEPGTYYPCKPGIFEATYEPVENGV